MSTYRQFKDIDPALIRGILLGEGATETTTDSQNEDGIMSRTTPSATSSTEQTEQEDLLVTTAQTMANASTDREALANAIVPPTPELRPQDFDIGEWETLRPIEDVLSGDPMYDMAKEDAQVQAAITSAKGITRSRTEPAGSGEVLTDVDPIRALDTPEVEETELSSRGLMSRMLDEKGKTPVVAGQTQGPESGIFAAATSPLILQDPEMSFIVQLESFREKPYELNSVALDPEQTHVSVNNTRSGLTVANGFDVGQHDKATLRNMGLSKQTIDKFGDWVGVNPDTIIDPNTGEPAANRRRGHELMADMYQRQEDAGTLPSFTMRELEQISKGSYDVLGRQEAKRAYGEGWDDLDPDVQAVLIQDVYVRGSISGDMEDRARRGLPALEVLEGMQTGGDDTHLSDRKDSTRSWLTRNSMSDDTTTLGAAGSQMLTNILAEELGLDLEPIAVDNRVGPATRARINTVLEEAGKEAPSRNSSGDAERRQLLEEVLEERLITLPEEES